MGRKSRKQSKDQFTDGLKTNGLGDVILGPIGSSLFGSDGLAQLATLEKTLRGELISQRRNLLSSLYAENGTVANFIDVPVDDAFNGGFRIISSQLDDEDNKKIKSLMYSCGDVEEIKDTARWSRLFGGAGLLVMTNQKPDTPLDLKDIDKLEFRACDLWELQNQVLKPYTDIDLDTISNHKDFDRVKFTYYGEVIDSSRIFPLKGKRAPALYRARTQGWGLSEVESVIRSLNQYIKSNNLSFEVLDEFKIDVFKFDGLAGSLGTPQGEESVLKRTRMANMRKRYDSALILDKEDEYEQKQLSFSGIAEVMREIKSHIAADLRMPMTKLFGMSSAGFNSGEDDIEVYNAMVESKIRTPLKPLLLHVAKLRCLKEFGMIPYDLDVQFESLRTMSSEQEENVKNNKFNRLLQARQAGEISQDEFAEGCNKENLLPITIKPRSIFTDLTGGLNE